MEAPLAGGMEAEERGEGTRGASQVEKGRLQLLQGGVAPAPQAVCSPFAALVSYSFTYFLAFGMLIIPAPMVFNEIVNGSPGTVTSASSLAFGVWGVVNMVAQFAMARAWGEASDAFGRKPCLLTSAFGTACLHMLCAVSPVLWPLYFAILVEGATSTAYSASQGYIADVSKAGKLGGNFGLYFGVSVGGGIALGVPLSAAVLAVSNGNPRASFAVSATICILGGLWAAWFVPESLPAERRRPFSWHNANPLGALRMATRSPYITGICIAYMLMSLARGGTQAIFVNYAGLRWHWPAWVMAAFFVVVGGGMAVYPRLLIPRFGEATCLIAGNALSALSALITALDGTGYVAATSTLVLMSGDVIYPATLALLSKQVPQSEQGAIQGTADSIRTICSGAGGYFVAAVFAYFISSKDDSHRPDAAPYIPGAGFLAIAGMHITAMLICYFNQRRFGPTQ